MVTDRGRHDADILVIALGADLDPGATPGLVEGGNEFYTTEGATRLRDILPAFDSGDAVVSVLGPFFKCPAAPYEAAIMLHDLLTRRGVRNTTTIKVLTSLSSPIPISPVASERIVAACREREIEYFPETVVTSLDQATKTATLRDGRTIPYDLFLGVPIHRVPAVVEESGLAVDGWIPVDPSTFETRFPDVYAAGDVTSAPVPRVGVTAEGEAGVVADVLAHRFGRGPDPAAFEGKVRCYIEFGGSAVAQFDANFLGGPTPTSQFAGPSVELAASKKEFGSSRRARWFSSREF